MSEPTADLRAILVAERSRLREELREGIVAPGPMTYGSQAAAASQVFEQQRDLALRDKNQLHLEAVEAAIARVDAGTFGTCIRCGRPIAAERLEALPWAAHCIDCQRIVAKGG
jgi:RNA polymerase-binding transcription factor